MMFRVVFWDILPCKMIVDRRFRVRTSETSVDNHFTRQYIPEDNSEQLIFVMETYCVLLEYQLNVYVQWTRGYDGFP